MARTAAPNPESIAEQVAERAGREDRVESKRIVADNLFPTGSTLLNLACSDHIEGGPELGTIVTMPGSSSSGKTLLLLTGFADAISRSRFDSYDGAASRFIAGLGYDFGGQNILLLDFDRHSPADPLDFDTYEISLTMQVKF